MNDLKTAKAIVAKIAGSKQGEGLSELDEFILGDATLASVLARSKTAIDAGLLAVISKTVQSLGERLDSSSFSNLVRNMTIDAGVRAQFVESGIPLAFLKVMKSSTSNTYISFAGSCLTNFLFDEAQCKVLAGEGLADILDKATQRAETMEEYLNLASVLSTMSIHDAMVDSIMKTQLIANIKLVVSQSRASSSNEIQAWQILQNISTPLELAKHLIKIGIFDEIFRSIKSDNVDVRFGACALAGNLTRELSAQEMIIKTGHVPTFIKMCTEYGSATDSGTARINALCVVRNLSVLPAAAALVVKSLPIFLNEWKMAMKDPGEGNNNLRFAFSLIYNLTTNNDELPELRKRNIVDDVMPLLKHHDVFFATAAKMTLANLVGHIEKHPMLEADPKLLGELCTIFQCSLDGKMYAELIWLLWAPVQCLANISVNDTSKALIVKTNVVQLVLRLFNEKPNETRALEYATKLIANLAFVNDVTSSAPSLMTHLRNLAATGETKDIRQNSEIALFQLEQRQHKPVVSLAPVSTGKHIMLSYPWKYQELFLFLKNFFETKGYVVWMDVDQMTSSVLQAMAGAVENAAVIVYCLASAYKESEACRTEGEYAYNLRKPMVPVKPDASYRPDGWLGALTGNKLYFEFTNPSTFSAKAEDLLKEVLRHGGVSRRDEFGFAPSSPAPIPMSPVVSNENDEIRKQLAAAEQAVKDLQKQLLQARSPGSVSQTSPEQRSLQIRVEELERRLEQLEIDVHRGKSCCSIQ
jgi:hypothetical protein